MQQLVLRPAHKPAIYSSSVLRRRALALVTLTFSWRARSTMALRLSADTLWATSAAKVLRELGKTWGSTPIYV